MRNALARLQERCAGRQKTVWGRGMKRKQNRSSSTCASSWSDTVVPLSSCFCKKFVTANQAERERERERECVCVCVCVCTCMCLCVYVCESVWRFTPAALSPLSRRERSAMASSACLLSCSQRPDARTQASKSVCVCACV